MRTTKITNPTIRGALGGALGAALVALGMNLALTAPARAQVVVVANGSPITEFDIQQRSKLMAASTHKAPSRQDVINELIDDRLKISRAKFYGFVVGEEEVDNAFQEMAARQHATPQQFAQVLERSGITPAALKARIRAQLTWTQFVRGKFSASLQVGDADIAGALKASNQSDTTVAYLYTLYPVTIVVPRGSSEAIMKGKLQESENLRTRFTSCSDGLRLARGLRDVAVREPVSRSSADLPQQLRDMLDKMEIGRLTPPEPTPQGLQMFALCGKKQSSADSPAKRELRDQIFAKRFEIESKKYLDEIRKSAMIEYKK
ncbi:MAG TPA: SurA N-terminal domain-containing protein [Pseudolabrys sp.]|nr:SurA N-terminal domain-containing protein [Pseudolabrys sp.]